MRVAFTSDLHIDITSNNRELLPYLAGEIERLSPDALVLAGDIANTLSGWDVGLEAFRSLRTMKFIVPGNHDICRQRDLVLPGAVLGPFKCTFGFPLKRERLGKAVQFLPPDKAVAHDY